MIGGLLRWIDDRLGTAHFVSHALRKAFPDHWSFMLGEINMYCFLFLVATGTFIALFFSPSSERVVYHGAYTLLNGTPMSAAYASALQLCFDVNGGLLMRQAHHWAALIFIAGISVHMARIFVTGAFRKPREINWLIGIGLLLLALGSGFTGYSLPDDLLSGTGLRIADSVLLSIPLIGTWASFLLLGGAFPSALITQRLFVVHVYLLPAAIGAALALHLAIVWRQKHTQFPGDGRSERNVVGSPLFPQYALKSASLALMTGAVIFVLGGLVQINPIWLYGPYQAWNVLNPAQPDWYVGWLEGALRLSPPVALHLWGHTIPSPFWPGVLLPGVFFGGLALWPWVEAAITGDRRAHHLLDRPRDVPWRTGLCAGLVTFAAGLTFAGSSDVQARYLHVSVIAITVFYRAFCLVAPAIAFLLAYAIASELRAAGGVHEAPRVRLRRNASGGFDEEPLS